MSDAHETAVLARLELVAGFLITRLIYGPQREKMSLQTIFLISEKHF